MAVHELHSARACPEDALSVASYPHRDSLPDHLPDQLPDQLPSDPTVGSDWGAGTGNLADMVSRGSASGGGGGSGGGGRRSSEMAFGSSPSAGGQTSIAKSLAARGARLALVPQHSPPTTQALAMGGRGFVVPGGGLCPPPSSSRSGLSEVRGSKTEHRTPLLGPPPLSSCAPLSLSSQTSLARLPSWQSVLDGPQLSFAMTQRLRALIPDLLPLPAASQPSRQSMLPPAATPQATDERPRPPSSRGVQLLELGRRMRRPHRGGPPSAVSNDSYGSCAELGSILS